MVEKKAKAKRAVTFFQKDIAEHEQKSCQTRENEFSKNLLSSETRRASRLEQVGAQKNNVFDRHTAQNAHPSNV